MQKKPIARIPASLFQQSDSVSKKIELCQEVRVTPTLSIRSLPIYDKTKKEVGILKVTDLGTFTILQINVAPRLSDKALEDGLKILEQVHGWFVRSRTKEVELLRVLQNPLTFSTQGNQAWLALSAIGFDVTSLGGK
jgi:hypothetical protein